MFFHLFQIPKSDTNSNIKMAENGSANITNGQPYSQSNGKLNTDDTKV